MTLRTGEASFPSGDKLVDVRIGEQSRCSSGSKLLETRKGWHGRERCGGFSGSKESACKYRSDFGVMMKKWVEILITHERYNKYSMTLSIAADVKFGEVCKSNSRRVHYIVHGG